MSMDVSQIISTRSRALISQDIPAIIAIDVKLSTIYDSILSS